MKRKFLSLLLAICLIAGLLPVMMVGAETTPTGAPTTPSTDSSSAPTLEPTSAPIETTGAASSESATSAPTEAPTAAPTDAPTDAPTSAPTGTTGAAPSESATSTPTEAPTTEPTTKPTTAPTTKPTSAPTTKPTSAPTANPTTKPSTAPVSNPTRPTAPAPTDTTDTTDTTDATEETLPVPGAMTVSINLCEDSTNISQPYLAVLTAIKGGGAVYATTNQAGIPTPVTDGSIPTDNYIKFEYPHNDLPTITLMNAKLSSTGNVLDLSSFDIAVKIMVIGDSIFDSTNKSGISRASYGDITILGPNTLTLNCGSSAIAFEGNSYPNSLILKGLTLKATTLKDVNGNVLRIPAGNLTVDGCTLDLLNRAGIAVFLEQGKVDDAASRGNATISNSIVKISSRNTAMQLDGNLTVLGSNMQFTSEAQALDCGENLDATNSTLFLEGNSSTAEAVLVGGDFNIRISNIEIVGTKHTIFNATTIPNLVGEYTVIAGLDRESATTYDEALLSTYQYFFAEAVTQPTVPSIPETEPTEPPTEAPSQVPTAAPTKAPTVTAKPTTATIKITAATQPVENPSGGNSVLFWILAVVMILGACGAATMAVLMLRKNAKAGLDEIPDEDMDP